MSKARDVMHTNVVTIPEQSTVEDAIRILIEHDISGAPVVDNEGHLVGIVSELQLLQAVYTPEIKSHQLDHFITRETLTVTEDALLSQVANIIVLHRIRRVPVLRDNRLIGIISRRDLLHYALQLGGALEEALAE